MFYSIPNYFDLGKVTKQSCFDAAKIVQNRYKFCPIICKICYLIRFRTLKTQINEIKYHKTYLETHAPGLISVRFG